jgi:hypothetical protein
MAKSRKRVFPKPVPRLTSKTAELLGKNSNFSIEASRVAIYHAPKREKSNINDKQLQTLVSLRKTMGLL